MTRDELRGAIRPPSVWFGVALIGFGLALAVAARARRATQAPRGVTLEAGTRDANGWIHFADGRSARDDHNVTVGPVLVATTAPGAGTYRDDGAPIVVAVLPTSRAAYDRALQADRLSRFALALAVLAWTMAPLAAFR